MSAANEETNEQTATSPIDSKDGLSRERSKEIYLAVRIEHLRKTVEEIQSAALPEDVAARDAILDALKACGYTVLSTGEGSYASAWVRKPDDNLPPELIAANNRLLEKRRQWLNDKLTP